MADYTATPNYAFKMPTDHANTNTWGGYNNGNWASVDGLIGSIKGQLAGNTLTLTRTSTNGAAVLYNGVSGTLPYRWWAGVDSETESGGNVGSNYLIQRFDDNGNYIDTPIGINRATGQATFADAVSIGGALNVGGAVSVSGNITTSAAIHAANIYATGTMAASGSLTGSGLLSKPGMSGTADTGHQYNFWWGVNPLALQNTLWLDNSNWGQIQTTSDYRMKKDIEPLGSMWDTVKALKPISYTHQDWTPPSDVKEGGDPLIVGDNIERWGFLAHELQETLVESAANGVKDDPVHVQSPNPFTVIAALTRALQEAMTRIEALEAAR